jgi:RHS repeat-associated protein
VRRIILLLVVVLCCWRITATRTLAFTVTGGGHLSPADASISADNDQRAIYLNPHTGRFWTMDTFAGNNEDPLSLHKYLYCQADPVNNTDPSGNEIESLMVSFSVSTILAQMPNVVSVGKATEALPEEGEKELIDRYNKAKAYLESRNVKHGGKRGASCHEVNLPIGLFLGPMPKHWICKFEHRGHWYGFPYSTMADHWAVICRTTPDVPQFKSILFDYWGNRPAGENPRIWFRDHYETPLEGSFDFTFNQAQKPYDYRRLDVIPPGAD